jgi:hypothetical protein
MVCTYMSSLVNNASIASQRSWLGNDYETNLSENINETL